MPRRRHSSAAFWLFLVILAAGLGWASNEWWRLPVLDLFDWQSGEQETIAESETEPAGGEAELQAESERATPAEPAEGTAAQPAETAVATAEPAAPPAFQSEPGPPVETQPAATQEARADPPQVGAATEPAETKAPADATMRAGEEQVASEQVQPREVTAGQTEDPEVADRAAAPGSALRQEAEAEDSVARQSTDAQDPVARQSAEAQNAELQSDEAPGAERQSAALQERAPAPDTQASIAPSFDIVRVERDGQAVIAGRAAPGAEVEVRSGERVIDRVRASRGGEWVAIPAEPLAPGDQQLSAVALRENAPAVQSEQVLVVAVPEPTQPGPSKTEPKSEPEEPVAVLLPRDASGTGRVLQAPGRLSAKGTLALTSVSYDESGKVLLSGEAPAGVPVRIYVDNRPAAVVVGDAKGTWASSLDENLGPGTYTLRLDQLDAEGQPVARIETPLSRASEPPIQGQLQVDYVVVQPGNSLWRIARRLSGRGLDYVYIYDANQAQIRDPDLIYPGQVFEIPPKIGSSG